MKAYIVNYEQKTKYNLYNVPYVFSTYEKAKHYMRELMENLVFEQNLDYEKFKETKDCWEYDINENEYYFAQVWQTTIL